MLVSEILLFQKSDAGIFPEISHSRKKDASDGPET